MSKLSYKKKTLAMICKLASSEKDRCLIKYTACAATPNISSGRARKLYGISELKKLSSRVEDALVAAAEIERMVNKLAQIKEKSFLEQLGIADCISSDEESSDDSSNEEAELGCDSETDDRLPGQESQFYNAQNLRAISSDRMLSILRDNGLNWFSFVEELKAIFRCQNDALTQTLTSFVDFIPSSDVTEKDKLLIEQSREAFLLKEEDRESENDIVSESESDDPEDYVGLGNNLRHPKLKEIVMRGRKLLKKKAKREFVKQLAERSVLKRRVPKKASKLLKRFPELGKDIENFVRDNRIGADAWRRTGVATFNRNTRKGPRATYKRIKEHLENKYNTKFSYRAIVQLSVVRNKRRRSRERYWGAANITCRRARKGFNVRLNVDSHWSAAFYKGLDRIQLEDGRDKTIVNRDDAAGFRLDTTYTHKQHKSISEIDNPELTTWTDFINKYSSVIQVPSYLVITTKTTPQMSAGIVKPHILYPKNPSQHSADLFMLQKKPEFESCLSYKPIDCIRVDGSTDEGRGHDEVQFLMTERHLELGKVCSLVTARSSGSSYLNRVELQNGCLAMAHSNIYIPSTIHGSNFHSSGGIDNSLLEKNLDTAANIYIDKCNGAPFQESRIILYKGNKDELARKEGHILRRF